jgi:heme exporter protein D
MAFAWKVMVPLAFYTIVITAVYLFYDWPAWSLTLMSLAGLAVVGYLLYRRMSAPARRVAVVRARQEQQSAQRRAANRAPGGLASVK